MEVNASSSAADSARIPRPCLPACGEKRDFMDHSPPRSEGDFYKSYDPMIGIGTAAVLTLFFITITIRSFIRWITRKVQFSKFEKKRRRKECQELILRESSNSANSPIVAV